MSNDIGMTMESTTNANKYPLGSELSILNNDQTLSNQLQYQHKQIHRSLVKCLLHQSKTDSFEPESDPLMGEILQCKLSILIALIMQEYYPDNTDATHSIFVEAIKDHFRLYNPTTSSSSDSYKYWNSLISLDVVTQILGPYYDDISNDITLIPPLLLSLLSQQEEQEMERNNITLRFPRRDYFRTHYQRKHLSNRVIACMGYIFTLYLIQVMQFDNDESNNTSNNTQPQRLEFENLYNKIETTLTNSKVFLFYYSEDMTNFKAGVISCILDLM